MDSRGREYYQTEAVFRLTFGELFVVAFLTATVVSARFWPRLGAWLGRLLAGAGPDDRDGKSEPGAGEE